MERHKHDRVRSANKELRGLVRQAENAADGTSLISWGGFQILSHRLSLRRCSIGEASRVETLDADLRSEIGEYVRNFRVFQAALEKVRRVMSSRQKRLEAIWPNHSVATLFQET